jgi:hypothetical protein
MKYDRVNCTIYELQHYQCVERETRLMAVQSSLMFFFEVSLISANGRNCSSVTTK